MLYELRKDPHGLGLSAADVEELRRLLRLVDQADGTKVAAPGSAIVKRPQTSRPDWTLAPNCCYIRNAESPRAGSDPMQVDIYEYFFPPEEEEESPQRFADRSWPIICGTACLIMLLAVIWP